MNERMCGHVRWSAHGWRDGGMWVKDEVTDGQAIDRWTDGRILYYRPIPGTSLPPLPLSFPLILSCSHAPLLYLAPYPACP
eukprot:358521-Chlamydomonas_euryale.AAC.2